MRKVLALCAIAGLVAVACAGNDTPQATPTDEPVATAPEDPTSVPTEVATAEVATAEPTATAEPAPAELRLVTYNAGLAEGFVPYASQRQPLVVEAISQLPADLVFVQEFWSSEAVAQLQDASATTFPHTLFPEPIPDEAGGEPSCTIEELADLEACVALHCADASPDELVGCVLTNCGVEFNGLCADCQACIGANVGKTVEEAISNCTLASSAFAYGGSVGVGVLSAGVILDTAVVVFDSSLNRRAVVYALVETEGFGPVHVFGTHLSAVFTDIPYPGDGTWEQEQAAQIENLLGFIDSKATAGDPVVLLGDFNAGPSGETYEAEVEANYELLNSAFSQNPYVEADDEPCTFCGDNPLVGGDASVVIDHIFVRDVDASATVARVLDESFDLDVDGAPTPAALSDHYGVLLTLTQ